MKRILILITVNLLSFAGFSQQRPYDITHYGAIGDGHTVCTTAIQKAIDAAGQSGGGKVIIPAGYYYTGQLKLTSGVNLFMADDATLLGSTNRLDYDPKSGMALIVAKNAQNISITGNGVINGQGRDLVINLYALLNKGLIEDSDWRTKRPTEKNRPGIIGFNNCDNVTITGITLKDAACWVQTYNKCKNLIIDNIQVESMAYWNNDGIDIVDCNGVKILNSKVNAADDGICLKSEDATALCENVEVSNCIIRSSASAFKLGTGSAGGFKHIKVNNLHIYDTFRSAIALEAVDGGTIEDVDIQHIDAINTGNAIFIRLGHRNRDERYSTLKHVSISNIKVEIPTGKPDVGYPVEGPLLKYPHNTFPSSITGIPKHPVQDITLQNITIIAGGNANKQVAFFNTDSLQKITENISGYPEYSMFGELPAWGLYVRHVDGLKIKNFSLNYRADDFRTACIFDDVKNLQLDGVTVTANKSIPVILLNNSDNASFENIHLPVTNEKGIRKQ